VVVVHDPQPLALPHLHGRAGARWVWLPRLLGDELRLISSLLGRQPATPTVLAAAGTAGEDRDPVCGMRVDDTSQHATSHDGMHFRFCSASCLRQFTANPQLFLRAVARATAGG